MNLDEVVMEPAGSLTAAWQSTSNPTCAPSGHAAIHSARRGMRGLGAGQASR